MCGVCGNMSTGRARSSRYPHSAASSFTFPVPGEGAFQLGLPDLLFFAIFLAAAARWRLRVLRTWALLVLSFGTTMALAIYADPFGIGGLPALPLLCLAFLGGNADILWRTLRPVRSPA